MKYKMNTTGSTRALDKVADQEDEMFIRIFYNGKFINYLFDPTDVKNLGLSTIFDVIDPDPDWQTAKEIYSNVQTKRRGASKIAA